MLHIHDSGDGVGESGGNGRVGPILLAGDGFLVGVRDESTDTT